MANQRNYAIEILEFLDQNPYKVFDFDDILKNLSIPNTLTENLWDALLTDKKWIQGSTERTYVHITEAGRSYLNNTRFKFNPPTTTIGTQNNMRDKLW